MKKFFLFVLAIFISNFISAQEISADELLNKVKSEFDKIEDYEVDARIKIDVDFLQIPETSGKIYFKKPDKIRLISNSFALIPKEGLNFSPGQFLNFDYSAILVGEEKLGSFNTYVVKVVPLSSNSDLILSTLWIDKTRPVVRKIETTTQKSGTVKITLEYNGASDVLPSQMELFINLPDFKVPAAMTGTITDETKKKKGKETVNGKIIISYSNYVINKGVEDSIFK